MLETRRLTGEPTCSSLCHTGRAVSLHNSTAIASQGTEWVRSLWTYRLEKIVDGRDAVDDGVRFADHLYDALRRVRRALRVHLDVRARLLQNRSNCGFVPLYKPTVTLLFPNEKCLADIETSPFLCFLPQSCSCERLCYIQ